MASGLRSQLAQSRTSVLCCPHNASSTQFRSQPSLARASPLRDVSALAAVGRAGQALAGHGRITRQQRVPLHVVAASATSEAAPAENPLILATLFAGWYIANIFFNIYNKQVLKVFASPLTLTTFQFVVGGALVLAFWGSGVLKRPTIKFSTIKAIFPLAIVHTLGNLLTNVSLGAVAVSFTHTIKAMEPFFSVLLSALFLGDRPSLLVLLTLVPIVGGVACASLTEASFNWLGFGAAMGSNVTFQSRNVLSKKLMIKKDGMDNINLFSIITLLSCAILLPFSLLKEGWMLTPQHLLAMGVANPADTMMKAVWAGVCFHTYQQVSYMILSRVSPVTHSIGNSVKRVVVIVGSLIVFKNPMSQQNAIGTILALFGVFAYSQVKRFQGKGKASSSD